ncbi:MAG TPA: hypothetical protein VMU32_10630 [Solirubrobacteraceae bacterium]|nr:hypothetical protein [Solirubrobacteraceae bacterium]
MTDVLPHGVTAIEAGSLDNGESTFTEINEEGHAWNCTGSEVVTCELDLAEIPSWPAQRANGHYTGYVAEIGIVVRVASGVAGAFANQVTVAGGGAASAASVTSPVTVSATPASSFGFEQFSGWFGDSEGSLDTQAGSHPYDLTVAFSLNTHEAGGGRVSGGEIRNITANTPPGVIGNPTAVPECSKALFLEEADCPADTQIGYDTVTGIFASESASEFSGRFKFPVYNLVPPPGIPAQFGFNIGGRLNYLDASVRSGGDYGISENDDAIVQESIVSNALTLWGEPSAPAHDAERFANQGCQEGCSSSAPRVPFLTLPTSCGAPGELAIEGDTWENSEVGEASSLLPGGGGRPQGFTGCDKLQFSPSISVSPDTSAADTPAGLTVDVKIPQEGIVTPGELSMSNIKDTTVTLPKGVAINPGQAAGLQACLPGDVPGGDDLPLPGENGEEDRFAGPPSCPSAAKVGTVQIATPVLTHDLEGNIYVLQSTPPNLELLVAASGEGVNVKVIGHVHLDEETGQLTTTFTNTPELPFTEFKLSFSGGAQAALTTPMQCGTYDTTSDFTPWSTPYVGDAFPESNFAIDTGTGGASCPPSPLPFTPSMIAGSTTDQAGGFTDFSMLLTRPDDQQRVSSLQFHVPEGLLGMISKVPLCEEPGAAKGECPEASQIGHTVVEAGPGPYPLVVPQPGQPPAPIYLTGPYRGAPYGLAIVVPLKVGPFTLPTQVVRARIEVNPLTTELTVTTDELPQTIAGVPADLRSIDAVIDRPGFMFNPTGCEPEQFSGTAYGAEGAAAPIASHFQMGSCRSLTFKPNFKVSTSARTSRADGASLTAKILYPAGELGANQASSQSNIARVKVELPKQLPSRLTTLQKACTAAQFDADPAGCPAASVVGEARAVTPVLPVPLTGPAYFVSHGGEAFPSLIVVLQGYGTTVDLAGSTFISKAGITSTTFKSVPDVPVYEFELSLPEGPFSALTANGNLCKAKKLVMPTEFTGHNGAEIVQDTKIEVHGCPKPKSARKHRGHQKKKGKKKKGKRSRRRGRP